MPQSAGVATRSGRAQSETIGIVLVFGLVILGASAVVVFGASAISDSEEGLEIQRAEKTLTQLDSKAALVALDNTDVQSVRFARDGGRYQVRNGSGWMNITVKNTSTGNVHFELEERLGEVTYENDDTTLSYQGGGVWRTSGNGSLMVSPPEFHFRNGTLTLPVINVTGKPHVDGGAALEHSETLEGFPVQTSDDLSNPLDQHRVFVTVQSDYYQAWGRYFEERTDGVVTYDHSSNEAILELVSPFGVQPVLGAASASAATNQLVISGSGPINTCPSPSERYVDSYNSSKTGDYCSQTPTSAGNLTYGGDVDVQNADIKVLGNITSGGQVTVHTNAEVDGDVQFTTPPRPDDDDETTLPVLGEENQISGLNTLSPIDFHVEETVNSTENSNDNGPKINGDRLDYSGGTTSQTLTSGKYYLEKIDFPSSGGETLTLDTHGGDIKLAVEDYIEIGEDHTIEVIGNGQVRIYVNTTSTSMGLKTGKQSDITTPDNNATQLYVYGKAEFQADIGESGGASDRSEFTGVIYAPSTGGAGGLVTVDKADVFGGIVTGDLELANQGALHYDKALRERQVVPPDARVVKVTYLHITVNRIQVSG